MNKVNTYEIWCEGYCATGNNTQAKLFGSDIGVSFKDACDNFFSKPENQEYNKFYNKEKLSYWGCKLFDNETDARINFG